MNTNKCIENCESSLFSSTYDFQSNLNKNNSDLSSDKQVQYGSQACFSQQNNSVKKNNIFLKGESIIDFNYFNQYKNTYNAESHPNKHFFEVIGTQKNKHFVEMTLQNQHRIHLSNDLIYSSLQSVNPTKTDKARKLLDFVTLEDCFESTFGKNEKQNNLLFSTISNKEDSESMKTAAYESAARFLNERSNRLYKFNLIFKEEDNSTFYLKHGVSNSVLKALQMSPDFYQYVHLRFGVAPFIDKYYAKNFFEINQNLLEQSTLQQNDQFQTKYVLNLSPVGAIYSQTECEILDLNNGFFLEIQYYNDDKILTSQISEVNKKLRIQAKERQYSSASSQFIKSYYPDVKLWSSSNLQEVDSDIVDKIIKRRNIQQQQQQIAANYENSQQQYSQPQMESSYKSNTSIETSFKTNASNLSSSCKTNTSIAFEF